VSEPSHDEIAELLGAYALNAVDPDERALVERHLDECPRCRVEVNGHREVAAGLGNSGGDAPDGLWDRIASTLDEAPPPMRLSLPGSAGPSGATVTPLARRTRVGGNRVVIAAMGAAAALVIGALGVKVVQQDDQIDRISTALEDEAVLSAANLALLDPEAVQSTLMSPDGALSASAVLLPNGTGYLLAHDLPALDDARTYQLWGQTGGGLISLGLLGAEPGAVVPFQASGDVAALAITEEVAGGVSQSENAPALLGRF
jgi:anti-sigma factor RsiW